MAVFFVQIFAWLVFRPPVLAGFLAAANRKYIFRQEAYVTGLTKACMETNAYRFLGAFQILGRRFGTMKKEEKGFKARKEKR